MTERKNEIIEAMTPVGKLHYVYVDQPQEDDEGKAWYKVTIAWPKSYKDTELKPVREAGMRAAKQFFGEKVPPLQPFLRDGDNEEHNTSDIEDLHGCYYFTAKSKTKPGCVDARKNDISPLDVYSGCEARVSIILGGYNNKGKKGVWIRLQNIQKARDGERIGGKPSAKKQFDNLDGFEDDTDGENLL